MSLVDGNGLSAADVAAVTGNNGGGRGGLFGGDGLFWIIILFLFAMMSGNLGNNGGGSNGGGAVVSYYNGVQEGFNQAAVMGGINAIQAAQNANQMALLTTLNANQLAGVQSMNNLGMSLQNCCCENRAGIADLKYTIATENCSDRQAISDGLRDLTATMVSNTQAILDKMCAQELEAERRENANLRTQLNMATLRESQANQTAQILANNEAQTAALEQYLAPVPRPAYIVQNPNCCQQNFGCGSVV